MHKKYARQIWRFLSDEHGPTSVEYAVMLALIFMVCVGAVATLGTTTKTLFTNANSSIQAAGS